jgi:hypothetical protein
MTYAATLAMSSSLRRPPNAGIAFLPLVTCRARQTRGDG